MKKMINEDQFHILVKFMEKHGDLRRSGDVRQREKIKKKWLELVNVLNRQGEKKSLVQWSKVWSDTKYNTVKKYKNSVRGGPQLTELEKIIIKIIKNQKGRKKASLSDIEDNANVQILNPINDLSDCEKAVKREDTLENESFNQENPEVLGEKVFYVLPPTKQRQDSLLSSNSSTTSFSPEKRRRSTDSVERLDEIANKFYELERERDKMAHEREMARIHQHNEFLSVMSRLVNVVETLAPSLQRFLDSHTNGR